MRIEKGYPNIQVISGQCVINPMLPISDIQIGHTINEGVETDKKGQVVAYHVASNKNTSNSAYTANPENSEYGTVRVPVYFKNTTFRQAWLYRASDLQKLGETRAMPLLSNIFESLQHVNDYIIANAKNAQLSAQMVIMLEKDANSTGERVFSDNTINVAGMSDTVVTESVASDAEVAACANNMEVKMKGNGFIGETIKLYSSGPKNMIMRVFCH